MQGEIWKPIKGYDGKYYVSNYGRIRSTYHASEKFLIPINSGRGYLQVALFKNHKSTKFLVHRLVAEYFVENPNGFYFVNHKDENKGNNHFSNLEWCDMAYNNAYGTRMEKVRKKVNQILDGVILATYNSISDAAIAVGKDTGSISRCCRGIYKTCGGYEWAFV